MNILIVYLLGCVISYLIISLQFKYSKSYKEAVIEACGVVNPEVVQAVLSLTSWFAFAVIIYSYTMSFYDHLKWRRQKRKIKRTLDDFADRFNK